jgi:hypothetical protein
MANGLAEADEKDAVMGVAKIATVAILVGSTSTIVANGRAARVVQNVLQRERFVVDRRPDGTTPKRG